MVCTSLIRIIPPLPTLALNVSKSARSTLMWYNIRVVEYYLHVYMRTNQGVTITLSKGTKIRNRYNQVPHLTQDTNGKVTHSQLVTTNENQEAIRLSDNRKAIIIYLDIWAISSGYTCTLLAEGAILVWDW